MHSSIMIKHLYALPPSPPPPTESVMPECYPAHMNVNRSTADYALSVSPVCILITLIPRPQGLGTRQPMGSGVH